MKCKWHEKMTYDQLGSKGKETHNYHEVARLLALYGYTCRKLNRSEKTGDLTAVDFTATHASSNENLRVQLESRPGIDQQYEDKSLHLAFPGESNSRPRAWFLVPHEELVALATEHTNWTTHASWKDKGRHTGASAPELIDALHEQGYCIGYATERE